MLCLYITHDLAVDFIPECIACFGLSVGGAINDVNRVG